MAVNTLVWQLGTPASGSFVTLPEPDAGSIDRTLVKIGGQHTSIAGSQTSDVFAFKRGWTLGWSVLNQGTAGQTLYKTILQYWDPSTVTAGAISYRGIGPFTLNDPLLPYQATVNILSVTDATNVRNNHSVVMTLQEV